MGQNASAEDKKAIALKMAEHLKSIRSHVVAMNQIYDDAKADGLCVDDIAPETFQYVIPCSIDEWSAGLIVAVEDWEAIANG